MNATSKNKTLLFIIVLLLITNIGVLGYFMLNNDKKQPPKKRGGGFVTALQKEVGFSEEQMTLFKNAEKSNWDSARSKMDEIRRVKHRIFALAQKQASDTDIAPLADSIGKLQTQVELYLFRHMQSIRAICTPEQLPRFDSLLSKSMIRPPRGKMPPPEADDAPKRDNR
ncbi:MAG: hypothetical protein QM727_04815 [Niabella sp.]